MYYVSTSAALLSQLLHQHCISAEAPSAADFVFNLWVNYKSADYPPMHCLCMCLFSKSHTQQQIFIVKNCNTALMPQKQCKQKWCNYRIGLYYHSQQWKHVSQLQNNKRKPKHHHPSHSILSLSPAYRRCKEEH